MKIWPINEPGQHVDQTLTFSPVNRQGKRKRGHGNRKLWSSLQRHTTNTRAHSNQLFVLQGQRILLVVSKMENKMNCNVALRRRNGSRCCLRVHAPTELVGGGGFTAAVSTGWVSRPPEKSAPSTAHGFALHPFHPPTHLPPFPFDSFIVHETPSVGHFSNYLLGNGSTSKQLPRESSI